MKAAIEERERVAMGFLDRYLEELALTCQAMAERFRRGGRLLAFGRGGAASDAQHLAVEFLHPVIAGKRALPALNLTAEVAWCSGLEPAEAFSRPLELWGCPDDIAIGLADDAGQGLRAGLETARRLGMLALSFTGPSNLGTFCVDSADPFIVQEVQETAYHILWELVHVFLDG